jgi:hypothetical protein
MRSLVDFRGLTPGDIAARLFLWFFGPAFVGVFFREFGSWLSILGEACVGVVVWWDASRARRSRPLVDAAIALIPLAGWWWYARARGIDILARDQKAAAVRVDRPTARLWNLRWSRRFEISTPLSPEASLQALRAVTLAWWSPIGAFASEAKRPAAGVVRADRFRVHRRRVMSRGIYYMEARGRIERSDQGSRVSVTVGPSVRTNFGLLAPLTFLVIWILLALAAGNTAGGVSFGVGFLILLLAVNLLVIWVGRDDDIYLEAVLRSALVPKATNLESDGVERSGLANSSRTN